MNLWPAHDTVSKDQGDLARENLGSRTEAGEDKTSYMFEAYLQSAVSICLRISGIFVARALEPPVLSIYLLAIPEYAGELVSILLMPRCLR